MKKRSQRLCTFSIAILLAFISILTGCATPSDFTETKTAANDIESTQAPQTEPAETKDPNYISELPTDLNYGNREISLLVEGQSFAADEFYATSSNGEVVNDAVFARNMAVEDQLGVKLKVTLASSSDVYDVGSKISSSVSSGDRLYDISTMPGYTHTSYVLGGNYYNLLDIENLNLDKYYWTQGLNQIMSNGQKQYITCGAYSLSMYRNMYITLYNKDILSANGIEDPYDIVLNNQWTIERQGDMIRNVYSDLNGSGTRDESDNYGFVSGSLTSVDTYWISLGMQFLKLSDGVYSFESDTDRLSSTVDKIKALLFDNEGSYCVGTTSAEDGSYNTNIISIFGDKRAAMCTTMIYQIENYLTPNNFDGNYGIAPIPKFDDAQPDYYTHVQDQLSVMSVVATVKEDDLPMIGAVMEATAAESYAHVYSAYYDTALSYRYLQDQKSVVMLDLIYNSIKIEGAFLYSSKYAMLGKMRSVISAKTNNLMSVYKGYQKAWTLATKQLNAELEKINH